jgi:hypothetical protein
MHSKDTRSIDNANTISVFSRVLDILSEYAPDRHKNILGEAANKSRVYMEVYNKLNQNIVTYRNNRNGIDTNNIINTLTILHPVLNSQQKMLIERIIKLNEVFR